jgi:hypothetical protein
MTPYAIILFPKEDQVAEEEDPEGCISNGWRKTTTTTATT